MSIVNKHIILVFAFLLMTGTLLNAQEYEALEDSSIDIQESSAIEYNKDYHKFTEKNIEEARAGIDYSDDLKEKKEEEKKESSSNFNFGKAVGPIVKMLFIGILIALLVAILVHMLGAGSFFKPSSKKIKGTVANLDFDEIESNLNESDLENLLNEAISKNEYKIAVRLYFLIVIRDMSLNDLIKWKKDKTNRDYLRETGTYAFHPKLQKAASAFDRVWYGEFNLNSNDFDSIQPIFKSLIQDIKNFKQ